MTTRQADGVLTLFWEFEGAALGSPGCNALLPVQFSVPGQLLGFYS